MHALNEADIRKKRFEDNVCEVLFYALTNVLIVVLSVAGRRNETASGDVGACLFPLGLGS